MQLSMKLETYVFYKPFRVIPDAFGEFYHIPFIQFNKKIKNY